MKLRLDYHPEAIAEAREAYKWYRAESRELADRFATDFRAGVARLRDDFALRPPYLYDTRKLLLDDFPYLLVHVEILEGVKIIAVAHTSRRPGYWRSRLRG